MNKYLTTILLSIILSPPPYLFADSLKLIILKDGSAIKGEVLKLENGTYTIHTANLGEVRVNDTDIKSISSTDSTQTQPGAQANGYDPSQKTAAINSSQLKEQVTQMQGVVLNDPQMMTDIQELVKDPEVMQLLSDPQLMNDLMSYDPNKIQQNPKMLQLMNNPRIQALIQQLQSKNTFQR